MIERLSFRASVLACGIAAGCASQPASFEQYGRMREVMRDGQVEPRVGLCEVSDGSDRYAVGAMAGLDGEVTIAGGEVWVTRAVDGVPVTTGPACVASDRATLLSAGRIADPVTRTLDGELSGAALEAAIAAAARDLGRPAGPFLFRIDGTALRLRAHVVAGKCPHADPTADVIRIDLSDPHETVLVGLYARGRPGELTHHGSDMHVHAILVLDGGTVTAHVDEVTLAPGARLTMPGRGR